jgi:hypothetical protein
LDISPGFGFALDRGVPAKQIFRGKATPSQNGESGKKRRRIEDEDEG